jgi:hypothetical protein
MSFYYEPLLCPRCKIALNNINETHKDSKQNPCKANKIAKGAFVYLMHDITNDLLKIGYSENPYRRHKEMVHGSTNEISLLGFYPGSKVNENIVHTKFKNVRVKREWFSNDASIIDYFTGHPLYKEHKT